MGVFYLVYNRVVRDIRNIEYLTMNYVICCVVTFALKLRMFLCISHYLYLFNIM